MSQTVFKIPEIIKNDFLRKLSALFFAIIIWYAVKKQLQETDTFRDVPVDVIPASSVQLIINKEKPKITLLLRGSKGRLRTTRNSDIKISKKLPSGNASMYDIVITKNDIKLPTGLSVADIQTNRIYVKTDIYIKKSIPVSIHTLGVLASGFKITSSSVIPSEVELFGASRILANIHEISTEPIYLDNNIRKSFEIISKLIIPKEVKDTNLDSVKVNIEVTEVAATNGFTGIKMDILNSIASNLYTDLKLPNVDVTFKGPGKILRTLNKNSIRAFIDISSISRPGRYKRPVHVWIEESRVYTSYIHPMLVDIELYEVGKPKPTLEKTLEKIKSDQ